jgi:hypothetical protein
MSAYVDPLTAITLAHEARADQVRRVAEHRRLRETTRSTRPGPQEAGAPRVVHRLLAAVHHRLAAA